MNKQFFILLFVVGLLLTACTTSKSTVSKNVDLAKYDYAAVINNDTYHIPAELMEYEIQLYDAVESSRLQLVSDFRIYELTPEQRAKLLLVKYDVVREQPGIIVIVNFIDYQTGRPVASCRGAFGLGIDEKADFKGAIKRLERQISEVFPKKD